jgi:hypothetical protein
VLSIVLAICGVIYLIITVINVFCGGCIDFSCKEIADSFDNVGEIFTLYKKFTNIPIPNLSYPDCELCNCKEGEPVGDGGVSNPDNAVVNQILNQSGINSILSKLTIQGSYIISGYTGIQSAALQNILSDITKNL